MDSRENHVLGRWKNMCGSPEVGESLVCMREERGRCMGAVGCPLGSEAPVLPSITVYLTAQ